MNRRAFLAGLGATIATPALGCETYRQISGMEVEFYAPTAIVVRSGSISIGTRCNVYSQTTDRVVHCRGEAVGWHFVYAIGRPGTGHLRFEVSSDFAVSSAARGAGIGALRGNGWTDIRLMPVAIWWTGTGWRPWFLAGGYPQPDVWFTDVMESPRTATVLRGSGYLDVSQWVPETGRALYAVVDGTGRIGTPGWGWHRVRRQTRDLRLLPDSTNRIAYDVPAGRMLLVWGRGYNVEQPT